MLFDAKPRVLIVDDDPGLASVIELMLDRAGCVTEVAQTSQAAMDSLQVRLPDAVLLDLMLPDIDGLDLLRQLRAQRATETLPVIVLTARSDEESRRACEAAGASGFLVKPVSRRELVASVRWAAGSPLQR